jgi:hypothetical protein
MPSQFYCETCKDPIEPHQPRPYGRKVPGLNVHVGENYLNNQRMSGLEPEEREQLRNWSHPIVAIDANGNRMDQMVGQQFRRY